MSDICTVRLQTTESNYGVACIICGNSTSVSWRSEIIENIICQKCRNRLKKLLYDEYPLYLRIEEEE